MNKPNLLSLLVLLFIGSTQFSYGQLSSGGVPPGFSLAGTNRLPVVSMPAINVDSLLTQDQINEQYKDRPYRFGYNHFVNLNTANSGTWSTLPDGSHLWQLDVKTAGSYTINLAFSNFHLANGDKLFVYSKDRTQVLGAFTAANNTYDKYFGTDLINDDEAIVELQVPAQNQEASTFTLFRITQGYKDANNYLKAFGEAGSCIHNINCPQYANYAIVKRAVVCLVSGGNEFCSGALVNNTLNDGTPYVLTANHCDTADGTWVFRFNWESPGCANPATEPSTAQSITGGVTVAHSGVSDFNLVRMHSAPPASYHPFYAGWNHSTVPATSVTCIHHPSGDIKKCSQASNAVTATSYDAGNGTALVWQIGQWTDGCTEPGSSGSPLFDQNKRIVGQLYGGPSSCSATGAQLTDYFGRFCVSWDSGATAQTRLKDWLDPNSADTLTNDGYDPFPPADSLDLALTGIISPADSSCSGNLTPVISVQNLGSSAVDSFTISYNTDGGAVSSYTWTGTLLYLGTATISLPAFTASNGAHTFHTNITTVNGIADQLRSNDSAQSSFVIYVSNGLSLPITEGFENGSFPPSGWNITTPTSGTTWASSSYGAYGTSSTSAHVDEFSPIFSTVGETPSLITPGISMVRALNPAILKFDVAYARYDALHSDSLAVLVSTDCGISWNTIYLKGGSDLATAPDNTNIFHPSSTQWRTDSVDISNLIGTHSVLFNFEVISGYGNVMYLDNINMPDTAANVGIAPLADNAQIQVYPNPFATSFRLQVNLNTSQAVDAGVYSVDGKKLITVLNNELETAGKHLFEINTQQLSSGVYILKVNERFFKIEKVN